MLNDFLEKNKKVITEKWLELLKTEISDRYRNRPDEELRHTVNLAFNGNFEVICNNNWKPIEEFIVFITKLRLERDFTLSEVQRAFGLFRVIMIDILPDNFSGDELKNALRKVNHSVDVTINRFSEYFQEKHDEEIKNMLKTLEEKVKERTKELKNSEQRYRTLVEDINDGYFVIRKNKIIFANNALCEMFKYSKKEMIGKHIDTLVKFKNFYKSEGLEKENLESVAVNKFNKEFPVEIKANKIFFENKPAVAGICRDITERQKIIENERLAVIGRLAAAFAHEIRNSLSSIKVNIQVIKNKLSLDDIDKKRMELIFRDIEKLNLIIRDTLFFSKPIELNVSASDINVLIEDIYKKFQALLQKKNIVFEKKLDEGAKKVYADIEKLEIVFSNLIYNAIDALETADNDKRIIVTTMQNSENVEIIFFDTGCGIENNLIKNIFKPFYTTKTKGMGLGLSNVERIVALHNGKINVVSEKNRFTEFKIILPC